MTVRSLQAILAAGTFLALAACTRQQVYDSGTAFRIQECERIADLAKRDECLALARKSYKEYEDLTREGAR
jgi:hypothetical protein